MEKDNDAVKPPFKQAGALYFERIWRDIVEGGEFKVGINFSDITPDMEEAKVGTLSQAMRDRQGIYADPFLFYFTAGTHTIRLEAVAEPMIIEQIFSSPGVGQLYIKSINLLDYDVFMTDCLFYTALSLLSGILLDISYSFIDPRIRMGEK